MKSEKTKQRTQYSTDLCHRFEDHTGEADGYLDGLHVGQLQQQGLVLRSVAQMGVSLQEEKSMFHYKSERSLDLLRAPFLSSTFPT